MEALGGGQAFGSPERRGRRRAREGSGGDERDDEETAEPTPEAARFHAPPGQQPARPGMAPRPHSCSAAAPHELAFASTGGRSGLLDELDDATGVSSALDFFLFLRLYLTLIGPFGPTTMSS